MEDTFKIGPGSAHRLGWVSLALAALLVAGCSNYVGTTAASFLRRIHDESDPNLRYVAYTKLAAPNCYDSPQQKAEAVQTLISKLEQGKEPLATRAVIVNTLGALGDPAARDVILKLVNDPEAVLRVQACRALGKVGKPEDATVLTRVMAIDTLEDCRIAAINALGDLKSNDPRILRMLIDGMRNNDPATRYASLRSLKQITGKDLGIAAVAWESMLPKVDDPRVATASTATTPAPVVVEPAAPKQAAYPPAPAPVQVIVDSRTEMDGKKPVHMLKKDASTDDLYLSPEPPVSAPPPGVGIGSYPATNPNLPPQR